MLTKKQKLILILLYCFRFLNSKQIQKFLQHKGHRRINAWLKDLAERNYIARDFKPIFGTLTKPAVCYLTASGRGYIRNNYPYQFPKYLKRIARDSKASKAFKIRCQIIADWYLTLFPTLGKEDQKSAKVKEIEAKGQEKSKTNKAKTKTDIAIVDYLETQLTTDIPQSKEKIPTNTLQFFTPAYFPSSILLEKIKPDAYVRKRTTKGVIHGFLFVLDAYIPRFLLRYSLKRIFNTLDEEYWEQESIHSLKFYFLCPNNVIIVYLRRLLPSFLESYYGAKPLQFHFVTRNQLYKRKNGDTEKINWLNFSSEDY